VSVLLEDRRDRVLLQRGQSRACGGPAPVHDAAAARDLKADETSVLQQLAALGNDPEVLDEQRVVNLLMFRAEQGHRRDPIRGGAPATQNYAPGITGMEDVMSQRTWFITGASRGFGRSFTQAALAAGDRVAATARDTASLDDLVGEHGDALLPTQLDVTDRDAALAAVRQAHERLGRLDVVVNNAGYGVSGAIEELTEDQARRQIEVNLFGALWVTQAALPILREQGSGWIVQVSSIGGLAAFPLTGIYHASKWALEGFSESLRQEVEPFGIKVLMVEPSGFRTDWAGSSMDRAEPIEAYQGIEPIAQRRTAQLEENNGSQPGNPELAAKALLDTLDRDDPPFRLLLGNVAYDVAVDRYESRLKEFRADDRPPGAPTIVRRDDRGSCPNACSPGSESRAATIPARAPSRSACTAAASR
jgi:NAD(P)-dependent dehydrogenase (short-subunit alcohol dehydrogenase family)